MTQDRFEELLGLLLDDDMSRDQLNALVEIVAADPLKLQRLREHLTFSDRLSQYEDEMRDEQQFLSALQVRAAAAEDAEDFVSQVMASVKDETAGRRGEGSAQHSQMQSWGWQRFRGLAGWVTVAVALLLLAGMLINQAIDGGRDETPPQIADEDAAEPTDVNDTGVAVLTRVAGLQGTTATDWRVGETIPPGSMAWDAGLVQLEFYCGATVVVEVPAEIEILDESRLVCRSGRLRAHVPEPARGFAVLAPSFELVDLGTEFGLDVSDDGVAEVHVFDGKVELYDPKSNRDQATRRELNAGDALAVDRDGTSKPIAARDADFVTPTRLSQMTDARQQGQHRDWRAFRDSLQDDPRVVAYFTFDRNESEDRLLVGNATVGNWSGREASDVRNFNGCMDELIVFGEALDDQEVRRIYEVGRP